MCFMSKYSQLCTGLQADCSMVRNITCKDDRYAVFVHFRRALWLMFSGELSRGHATGFEWVEKAEAHPLPKDLRLLGFPSSMHVLVAKHYLFRRSSQSSRATNKKEKGQPLLLLFLVSVESFALARRGTIQAG